MPRQAGSHPDPLVSDLQSVRRLLWSQPNDFEEMGVLLDHPLVVHIATGSTEVPRRVKALRTALERVVKQIERREARQPPPLDRSVAFAAKQLLRLDPKTENKGVESLRERIAERWKRNEREHVSPDGFRQHLEVRAVYEPLAGEFRSYAAEQADRQGFASTESNGGEPVSIADPAPSYDLGRVAQRVWEFERASLEQRLTAIRDGALRVRNAEEMVGLLVMLTETAEQELKAVDHVDISEWFGSTTLNKYLHLQLDRARRGEVELERIRLVADDELASARRREQLAEFVEMHDDASANLLLCPLHVAADLRTSFSPRMGLLMVDPKTEPVVLTGWVGDGLIERALLYTRPTDTLREFQAEYDRLKTNVVAQDHDAILRAQLSQLVEPTSSTPRLSPARRGGGRPGGK